MDEDENLRKPAAHEVGMALDSLSIDELQERIAVLEGEIERLRQAITQKSETRSAADAVFKF